MISNELAKSGQWELAQSTVSEISHIADRQNCLKIIGKNICTDLGMQIALRQANQFQDPAFKIYFLKGILDSVASLGCSKEIIMNAISYYSDDIESLEKLLQQYALHELFFTDAKQEKTQRFNRTLNIQWAIDIAAKFEKEFERASHNVQEWINEIEDENDREDVLCWSEKVAQGKMTEDKFLERINKL